MKPPMADASPSRPRPLSPHVWQWRWHVTMAASILNRMTGMGLYGGLLLVAGWAWALASGEGAYSDYLGVLASWPGRIVLFGVTFSAFFHLAAGLRHLGWDSGNGFAPKTANSTAWAALGVALIATVATWWLALAGGAR